MPNSDFQDYAHIAKLIDHALLSPALTASELDAGIMLARTYDVASVCILPFAVRRCAEILAGSTVRTSTTIGFPHGAVSTACKLKECEVALEAGCEELDVVVNISQVLSQNWGYVRAEIKVMIDLIHGAGQQVKVIFENCYLNREQKIQLCEICGEFNADWVKTSTGFGTSGAKLEDVRLMREFSPAHVQVKAAGGIRDLSGVLQMQELGVTRVGASQTQAILDECRFRLGLDPIEVHAQSPASGY